MSSLTANLVAYYKLDGNANNSLGNYNGTASNVSWVAGKIVQAGSFNGSNSKITFTSPEMTNVSVGFIMKLYSTPSSDNRIILTLGHSSGVQQLDISHETDNKIKITTYNGSVLVFASNTTFSLNTEYFILVTKSGTTVKLYVNGVLDSQSSNMGSFLIGGNNCLIGNHSSAPRYFHGLVDEVSIFNATKTNSDAKDLYNNGRGLSYPFIKPNLFKRISTYIGSATSSFNPAFARRRLLLRK